VTMVIGNRPEVQISWLKPVSTLAAVIANEFSEATGTIYPAALMECGLILMAVTLVINVLALLLVRSVAEATQ
jgi:phosphate transport system permease protein